MGYLLIKWKTKKNTTKSKFDRKWPIIIDVILWYSSIAGTCIYVFMERGPCKLT
jgi:hypothetical protein